MSRRKKKDDLSDVPSLEQLGAEIEAFSRRLDVMMPGFREERLRREAATDEALRRLIDAQAGIIAETRTPAEDRVSALEMELAVARTEAFLRGALAMREAAARLVDDRLSHTLTDAADRIRALAVPADELLKGQP